MTREVARSIHVTSAVAAGIAAILSPIPLADEIVFIPVYGWLARRVAKSHALGWLATPWRAMMGTAVNGLLARATINLAVSFVPGVAAVANAASAVALTEFLGRYFDEAASAPASARVLGVRAVVDMLRRREVPAAGDAVAEVPVA